MSALPALPPTSEPTPPPGDGWREVHVEPDGLYDEDQGELIFAGPARDFELVSLEGVTWARPLATPFAVGNLAKADWAFEQIAASEAQVQAIRLRKQALLANLDRQERQHQRRADWFRTRFSDEIAAVARAELAARGGRSKTLTLDHGRVAFRSSPGTTRILDEAAALEWAREHCPAALSRKEWITATNARRALDAAKADGRVEEDPRWIESSGPRETVRIETGIGSLSDGSSASSGPSGRSSA